MIARAGWIALGIAIVLWLAVFWATGPSHCTAPDAHHHISCQ